MRNRRHVVLVAGLAGALTALLAGSWSARADELSDLRSSQTALEKRLDQLARGQSPGPGEDPGAGLYPGPGNKAAGAGSFPRSFRIPGTNTSVRIGGTLDMSAGHFFNGGNDR